MITVDNNNINDLSPLCGLSIQIMGIDSSREKGKGSNLGIFAKNPSSSELRNYQLIKKFQLRPKSE